MLYVYMKLYVNEMTLSSFCPRMSHVASTASMLQLLHQCCSCCISVASSFCPRMSHVSTSNNSRHSLIILSLKGVCFNIDVYTRVHGLGFRVKSLGSTSCIWTLTRAYQRVPLIHRLNQTKLNQTKSN